MRKANSQIDAYRQQWILLKKDRELFVNIEPRSQIVAHKTSDALTRYAFTLNGMGVVIVPAITGLGSSGTFNLIGPFLSFGIGVLLMIAFLLIDYAVTHAWHESEVDLGNHKTGFISQIASFENSILVEDNAKAEILVDDHIKQGIKLEAVRKKALGRQNNSAKILFATQICSYIAFLTGAILLYIQVQQ